MRLLMQSLPIEHIFIKAKRQCCRVGIIFIKTTSCNGDFYFPSVSIIKYHGLFFTSYVPDPGFNAWFRQSVYS